MFFCVNVEFNKMKKLSKRLKLIKFCLKNIFIYFYVKFKKKFFELRSKHKFYFQSNLNKQSYPIIPVIIIITHIIIKIYFKP